MNLTPVQPRFSGTHRSLSLTYATPREMQIAQVNQQSTVEKLGEVLKPFAAFSGGRVETKSADNETTLAISSPEGNMLQIRTILYEEKGRIGEERTVTGDPQLVEMMDTMLKTDLENLAQKMNEKVTD